VAPINLGSAPVSWQQRDREVVIIGSTSDLLKIRHWELAQGRFLPAGDPEHSPPVCVIGSKVRRELFGAQRAIGEWLRIGDWRFRVIGVLASEGRSIGVDVEDLVIIPVAAAQSLFNEPSLFRILVEAKSRESIERARADVGQIIRKRHQGKEDVTVITQDAVLDTFDRILQALTLTVAGIAAVSLAVAGMLILNVMLVAVTQRTAEIGLLKALGASARQIQWLFLSEAALLSLLGAAIGALSGELISRGIGTLYPTLEFGAPGWAYAASVGVALLTGVVFGAIPARRAARLEPVQALARH
jgi:putative ABC transport system permease protein